MQGFWIPEKASNEEEIESFKSSFLKKYNNLCRRCNVIVINEMQNRRFVYVILDLWTDWLQKIHGSTNIHQFTEKYTRNIDSRYVFDHIDVVVGEASGRSLNPNPLYLVVETKSKSSRSIILKSLVNFLRMLLQWNFKTKKI